MSELWARQEAALTDEYWAEYGWYRRVFETDFKLMVVAIIKRQVEAGVPRAEIDKRTSAAFPNLSKRKLADAYREARCQLEGCSEVFFRGGNAERG